MSNVLRQTPKFRCEIGLIFFDHGHHSQLSTYHVGADLGRDLRSVLVCLTLADLSCSARPIEISLEGVDSDAVIVVEPPLT
jgi:hypothetical protein